MIERYTRPEMGSVWTLENRFQKMLDVEIAVAEVQADLGIIPKEAAHKIRSKGTFSVERIAEIEKTTRHDVIAFVSNVAENVGSMGRYVHFGLTSSDVLDTAMSLLVRDAGKILLTGLARYESILKERAVEFSDLLCAGRTHGMHAEPTSFGMKLAGFWAEAQRNRQRLERALQSMQVAKLSGAVGTHSTQTHEVEDGVARKLRLEPEVLATQVIPRDRHAEMMWALAMIGNGLERLAIELRHLQRTEVYEVVEGFAKGQKGSSAMPHKKNPISAENITGCARLLRAYSQAASENIALWHERDISHSAVERVIFPDAFIICDYAVDRMARLIESLEVQVDRMKANMDFSRGQLFSSHLLLSLVEKGLSREEAYAHVQRLSHQLKPGVQLRDEALRDRATGLLLNEDEVDEIFGGQRHRLAIRGVMARAGLLSEPEAGENRGALNSDGKETVRRIDRERRPRRQNKKRR
jgi:adenylosuccinate lyase